MCRLKIENAEPHFATSPVRPTTILDPLRLSERLGGKITLASETFQHTGSFKNERQALSLRP